jgi:uncharacterized delta-60 repeat protein
LVGGDFTRVNGVYLPLLIRLNADGSLDNAFNDTLHQTYSQFEGVINDIKVLPNGKILIAGDHFGFLTQNEGRILRHLMRLNSDGTYDNTFAEGVFFLRLNKIQLLANGKILIGGNSTYALDLNVFRRLNEDGTLDSSFAGVNLPSNADFISDFEVLPNNQIIVVGKFNAVNNFTMSGICRINSDGSLDLSFNTNNSGASGTVTVVKVSIDGKILIGGNFTAFNNVSKNQTARLNFDGSLDTTFNYAEQKFSSVNTIQLLNDDRIFIAGRSFNQILNPNGTVSPKIDNLIGESGFVRHLAHQPDGKILAGGRFATANGIFRNNLVRYNTDGTVDTTFNPLTELNNFSQLGTAFTVQKIIVQSDGKILVAIDDTSNNISGTFCLRRLNTDGTRDTTFNEVLAPFGRVIDIQLQTNGQILAFGTFRLNTSSNTSEIVRPLFKLLV